MRNISRYVLLFAVTPLAALSLTHCAPTGGSSNTNTNTNTNGNQNTNDNVGPTGSGKLAGQVVDVNGTPLFGVAVATDSGLSATTDDNGFYSFDRLPAGTVVARFAKAGFATNVKRLDVAADQAAVACVVMAEAGTPQMIDAATTGTYTAKDSRVTIEGGSLMMPDGTMAEGEVELVVTKVDPSTNEVMTFPGSFETAMDTSGATVQLESFGFATYALTMNGEPVDLAPGHTATIEYVLPANSQDQYEIGDTIPLWEFDEDTAMWMQTDRVGTIQLATDGSGLKAWVAEVPHFSSWNCDAPLEEKTCVSGTVVDDEGGPVVGATVDAVGVTYNGTSSDTTDGSGRFCVDVKRGSTVRLEVRVNGAATPLATREVTVPDESSSCATGGCTDAGAPISVAFTSCVRGTVTDNEGNPVADEVVYVVPGETVRTDANGEFCARAPGGIDVFVFALGRQSTRVSTPPAALCPSAACAEANINVSFPQDGDQVGSVSAGKVRLLGLSIPGFNPDSFNLSGSFFAIDAEQDGFLPPGTTQTTEMFGECTVYTLSSETTFDPENPDTDSFSLDSFGFAALDPGTPGRAQTNGAAVDLLAEDPALFDPPQPVVAGFYRPDESSDELFALGFNADQDVTFSWPGGADIGPFMDTVHVPRDLVVTSPNLSDPDLVIATDTSLVLNWDPGDAAQRVSVFVTGSTSSFMTLPDGTFFSQSMSVTIQCTFPDNGSATVPATVMARMSLPVTSFSLTRQRSREINVPLRRTGGTGVLFLQGSTSISRSFAASEF